MITYHNTQPGLFGYLRCCWVWLNSQNPNPSRTCERVEINIQYIKAIKANNRYNNDRILWKIPMEVIRNLIASIKCKYVLKNFHYVPYRSTGSRRSSTVDYDVLKLKIEKEQFTDIWKLTWAWIIEWQNMFSALHSLYIYIYIYRIS